MQRQSIEELLRIANSKVSELKYQRHVELLEKNQAGSITAEERTDGYHHLWSYQRYNCGFNI
ncbi:MAG: hypothetical protein GDA56_01710 [Hormoscilla sp. GM7CHS1pb]|nr:hypothetical protein [Hormoscilla sp. GM7CHS1pb]